MGDAFDGSAWAAGVRVELDEGWKTYWRMPGDAGIPPEFNWSTSVPADIEVLFPLPTPLHRRQRRNRGLQARGGVSRDGEAAGSLPALDLKLDLFLGVCHEVCIPVRASATLELGPPAAIPWAVPVVGGLDAARAGARRVRAGPGDPQACRQDGPRTRPRLAGRRHLWRSRRWHLRRIGRISREGRESATLDLGNVTRRRHLLKGKALKLTVARGDAGLEQTITLP